MGKVAHDVALGEFARWAEHFEIDTNTEDLLEDELKEFNTFRAKFLNRVKSGALVVDEDGVIEFTPRGDDEPLKFDEPVGAVLSARQKTDTDVQASRRVLSAWTGAPAKTFADMKLRDVNFCMELLAFFGNS